jgi:hypothetical protein
MPIDQFHLEELGRIVMSKVHSASADFAIPAKQG